MLNFENYGSADILSVYLKKIYRLMLTILMVKL